MTRAEIFEAFRLTIKDMEYGEAKNRLTAIRWHLMTPEEMQADIAADGARQDAAWDALAEQASALVREQGGSQ